MSFDMCTLADYWIRVNVVYGFIPKCCQVFCHLFYNCYICYFYRKHVCCFENTQTVFIEVLNSTQLFTAVGISLLSVILLLVTHYVVTDLQMVNISLRVLSRPDARMLPAIYRQLGTDYDERVLPSICNEVHYSMSAVSLAFSAMLSTLKFDNTNCFSISVTVVSVLLGCTANAVPDLSSFRASYQLIQLAFMYECPPHLHLTTSKVMLIVWRLRGNIIRTVLYIANVLPLQWAQLTKTVHTAQLGLCLFVFFKLHYLSLCWCMFCFTLDSWVISLNVLALT